MIKIEKEYNQAGPWLDGRVPDGYWNLKENRIKYMRWLGKHLCYDDADDWYGIRQKHFQQNHGGGLLGGVYSDSPQSALREFMPDRQWFPWLFNRTPQGYWQDIENRRAYMRWLEKQLGIKRNADWYHVTKKDFCNHHGAGLLGNYYHDSVAAAVAEFKPRMQLEPWRFDMVAQGFWLNADNHRRYMDWLSEKLKIKTPELWYNVTSADIEQHHGITLLGIHGSVLGLVTEYLPSFDWKPWLFQKVPNSYWQSKSNRQSYLLWLGKKLGFRRPADWYDLTHMDFRQNGGMGLFTGVYRNSLSRAAAERYPNYPWNARRFQHYARIALG